MCNGGEERKYKGVRKRKWGKYVAEIRAGKRSRISLGSFFTAEAAARAYDTALLCLRGPNATSFNFPDSTALDVGDARGSPSHALIQTAARRVGYHFDTVPAKYYNNVESGPGEEKEGSNNVEAGPGEEKEGSNNVEAGPSEDIKVPSTHFGQAVAGKGEDENMSKEDDAKYLLHSPEELSIEERVQMSLSLPHDAGI